MFGEVCTRLRFPTLPPFGSVWLRFVSIRGLVSMGHRSENARLVSCVFLITPLGIVRCAALQCVLDPPIRGKDRHRQLGDRKRRCKAPAQGGRDMHLRFLGSRNIGRCIALQCGLHHSLDPGAVDPAPFPRTCGTVHFPNQTKSSNMSLRYIF